MGHRSLYDEDFLAANCNTTIVAFDPDLNVDDSAWTYRTNYAVAASTIFLGLAIFLYSPGMRLSKNEEFTTLLIAFYLINTGIGYGIAGVGHQVTYSEAQLSHAVIPRISYFFVLLGNAALIRVALQCLQIFGRLVGLIWFVGNAALIAFVVYDSSAFWSGVGTLSGAALMALTFFLILLRKPRFSTTTKAFAMVTVVLGYAIQPLLAPICGDAAYEDCFVECPLPAPDFNHNALYHSVVFVGFSVFGISEFVSPTRDIKDVLRGSRSETAEDGRHSVDEKV